MDKSQDSILSTIIYIAAWLFFSAFAIADVLMVREATRDVMTAVQVQATEASDDPTETRLNIGYITEAFDRGIIVVGGLVAVGFALYFEYYFRKGREQGLLYKRIGKVFVILLSVLVVSFLIQYII
jgi:hypothetical protein